MFKKIHLGFKILLPFAINILLFLWIFDSNQNTEYALTNSLFYVGIISLLFGIGSLFVSRGGPFYSLNPKAGAVNLALADQHVKNYHAGKDSDYQIKSIITAYIKLIYIVLGIMLCIASVIVYFVK